mmetsp:Transcript_31586/g.82522  ORF Transcript_31586/g.82522 Transcript_31586/m.82522 type:complete len:278 (-) Transcript_31586:672-1505(-)
MPLLPGVDVGAVRAGAGGAAARDDAFLPALAVRRRQAVRLLDRRQLPRGVRHPRVQRHPLQPRVAAQRAHVRHAKGDACGRAHPQGAAERALHGQHRRQARLGPRARLRADDVDDAAAGDARRLRGRHRRDQHGAPLHRARLQVRARRHHHRLAWQGGALPCANGPRSSLECGPARAGGNKAELPSCEAAGMSPPPLSCRLAARQVDEVGFDKANPERVLVRIDKKYFRPTEVELLIGDPTKAKAKLGWVPTTKMEDLCEEMVRADIALVEKGDMTS